MRWLPAEALYAVGGRVRDEFRARLEPHDCRHRRTSTTSSPALARGVGRAAAGRSASVERRRRVVFGREALGARRARPTWRLPRRERSTGTRSSRFRGRERTRRSRSKRISGRRDFRMNMIARRIGDDAIVDPFGGVARHRGAPHRHRRAGRRSSRIRCGCCAPPSSRRASVTSSALRRASAMTGCGDLVRTRLCRARVRRAAEALRHGRRPSVGHRDFAHDRRAATSCGPKSPRASASIRTSGTPTTSTATISRRSTPRRPATSRCASPRCLHDVGKPRTKDGPHFYRHEHVGADMAVAMLDALALSERNGRNGRACWCARTCTAPIRSCSRKRFGVSSTASARRICARLFALRHADIIGSGLPKRSA